MNILIGCECSGIVRDAFRALGHDAYSCDLKSCERGPQWHLQCDVFEAINSRKWEAAVFHPPCDFLTVSGNRWFSDDAIAAPGILTGAARRQAQAESVEFVKALWACLIPKVAIENPIGRLSTLWMKPTQIVQPFHFGDPFRKATCLWLRGLPKLIPTNDLGSGKQACWKMGPSETRKADRARTYPGFAKAMAERWSVFP